MSKTRDQQYLLSEQYSNADNLKARISLHERFSTSTQDFHHWVFEHIAFANKAKILELGAGSGRFWVKNQTRLNSSWSVTLSDLSGGMLDEAKKVTQDSAPDFSYQVIDAQSIPYEDNQFDIVLANHMLYHVPDIDKAIAEVKRVLKPDGRFYAATNGEDHLKEIDDFAREHIARKLNLDFELMRGLSFRLENGDEILKKQFDSVKLKSYKDSLEVTDEEAFLAYILSMTRLNSELGEIEKQSINRVIDEARVYLKTQLNAGPIYVTKSTGLFESSSF